MRLGNDGASASAVPAIDDVPGTEMVGEDGSATATDLPTSDRPLVAHTMAGQPITATRRLMKQSASQVDLPAELSNLTRKAFALGNQKMLLVGDATGSAGLESFWYAIRAAFWMWCAGYCKALSGLQGVRVPFPVLLRGGFK